jgi:two-component system, chemotaxis family, CheB/CheR fusion protein
MTCRAFLRVASGATIQSIAERNRKARPPLSARVENGSVRAPRYRSISGEGARSNRRERWHVAKKIGSRRPGGAASTRREPEPSRPKQPGARTAKAPTTAAAPNSGMDHTEGSSPTVVGIGASAGGLNAFTELLSHLPCDTGMAFVLIQHLDPTHESHLPELLSRASAMPVSEVRGATRAEANHVYVIPPRCNLGISDGILQTPPRPERGRNLPVDSFLSALAADRGNKAIGVVLSGTASDGTLGLRAIKAAGGITFAQERQTAKFDSMPASAIAAGVVDFVLPPAKIAGQLVAIARNLRNLIDLRTAPEQSEEAELGKIFRILRSSTGVDFANYKHSTLQRRIRRRMALRGFENLEDYCRDLERNSEEANVLCESFLITVTQFFREPAVFEELKRKVFPALMDKGRVDPIRIWAPGCATGEEAYSIAICLMEFFEEANLNLPFEIFATDICETAIEKARVGIYAEAALANVSPQRSAQFFTRTERGFQIAKNIRDACVFARHDVTQDPPFSKLDLISCCNVLIYLGAELQRKVLSVLHYALKPAGFLVLGPSESIGALSNSFHQVDKTHKIYRLEPAANAPAPFLAGNRRATPPLELREGLAEGRSGLEVEKEADRLVLAEHGPPGAIIDEAMNVVQVRGRTAPYLELSPGNPTHNLLKLAREGLVAGLATAIRTAKRRNAPSTEAGFRTEDSGQPREVAIKVIPFTGSSSSKERHFLVLFEDVEVKGDRTAKSKVQSPENRESARLRRELAATKEYLQSISDDNAATLEELRAANEETQAGNEELETAQEELESANEELNTLNESLKISNAELSQVNRDLTNLLESISIPLVMVGRDLRIRRFTRAMEPFLNLIASDVGRSVTDLQPQLELPDLRRLLLDAMEKGDRKPRDIRDSHGRWYSLRILPSMGPDGKTDGAVLMLIDIDAAKRGLDFAEAIVETVREPLVILNQNLQVVKANRAFYETFRTAREETENRLIYDLGNEQWNIPKLRELLESILPAHSTFRDFEVTHDFEHVGRKVMLLNASEIYNPNAQARTILLAIEDATDRKHAEEALQTTNAELQHFAYALTHDLQEPVRMVVNFSQLLARECGGKLGEEADQFIAYSVEGALRIEALLKALLAYWEVTEHKQEGFASLDCGAILAKTLLNLQVAIAESGAVVTSDPLPTVVAEEVLLMQVFQNLISNSIKFRAGKPPEIHVSAERISGGWLFAVRDNGIGIDPQDSDRVFGMFKRLHGSEVPGTGIGLALCKKLVERQGGRIWVESGTENGATFKFTILNGRREPGPRPAG